MKRRRIQAVLSGVLAATFLLSSSGSAYETGDHRHPDGTPGLEGLTRPGRALPATPYVTAKQKGRLVHFLYAAPARIERYDLDTQSWLAMVLLPPGPVAFDVDASGIFVAYESSLYAFEPDGTRQRFLRNLDETPIELFAAGAHLVAVAPGKVSSVQKSDGALIAEQGVFFGITGATFDGSEVLGRTAWVSPADVLRIAVHPDGTLGSDQDSPYHGDFSWAERTFLLPATGRFVDDSGIVYDATDLTYQGSLAGAIDALAAAGDAAVFLRGGNLVLVGADFLRQGVYSPAEASVGVFARAGAAFSVALSGGIVQIERIAFSDFTQPMPGTPPAPDGLDFLPDELHLAPDGVVYLLSAANRAVYRWSSTTEDWISTLATVGSALDIALSGDGLRLFLSYPGGEITVFDLEQPSPIETPFVNSPQTPFEISTAGEILFVSDPSGAWSSHWSYSPSGTLVSWKDWNYVSEEFVWSPPNGKMYFFRDDTSPNDLLWEEVAADGTIGIDFDSPYHGDYPMDHPIRLDPAGTLVLIGSGHLFDAASLVHLDHLPLVVADAAWTATGLFTLEAVPEGTRIGSWSGVYEPLDTRRLPGAPLRLFALTDRLLVVTLYENRPRFWLRRENLDGTVVAVGKTDARSQIFAGEATDYQITVENLGDAALAGVFVEDLLPFGLENASWTCSGTVGSACPAGPVNGDIAALVDLAVGGSVQFSLSATVLANIVGTLRNRASAYVDGSEESAAVDATDVVPPPVFADGFEGGTTDLWSFVVGGL